MNTTTEAETRDSSWNAPWRSAWDMPASNTKILTAVAAMHVLGPDYRFSTDVVRRGSVTEGVLHGSLYLVGHGDPTTRQSDYAALAKQVRAAGITRAIVAPSIGRSIFAGQGAVIDLGDDMAPITRARSSEGTQPCRAKP